MRMFLIRGHLPLLRRLVFVGVITASTASTTAMKAPPPASSATTLTTAPSSLSSLSPSLLRLGAMTDYSKPFSSCTGHHHTTTTTTTTSRRPVKSHSMSPLNRDSMWCRPPLPDALPAGLPGEEMRTSRGSGPGGQGVNASSNKVQLWVPLTALEPYVRDDVLEHIRMGCSSARHYNRNSHHSSNGGAAAASSESQEKSANPMRTPTTRPLSSSDASRHANPNTGDSRTLRHDDDDDDDNHHDDNVDHPHENEDIDVVELTDAALNCKNARTFIPHASSLRDNGSRGGGGGAGGEDAHTKPVVMLKAACHYHRSARENERACRAMILKQLRQAADAVHAKAQHRDDQHTVEQQREMRRRAVQHPPSRISSPVMNTTTQQTITTTAASLTPGNSAPHASPSFAFSNDFSKRLTAEKHQRRKKGNLRKMQRTARRGQW